MTQISRLLRILRLNDMELEDSDYIIVNNPSNEGNPAFFLRNTKPAMKTSDLIGWCKFKDKNLYTCRLGLPFMYPLYIMLQTKKIEVVNSWNDTLCISIPSEELKRVMEKIRKQGRKQSRTDFIPKKKRNRKRPMCEFLRKKYEYGMGQIDESETI